MAIFPPIPSIFRALELVHFNEVKVLILGQDPYHGFGQANGLSFSVNREIMIDENVVSMVYRVK